MVLTVAAISGMLSIPIVMLLEFIVVFMLCHPMTALSKVVPTSLLEERGVMGMQGARKTFTEQLYGRWKRRRVCTEREARLVFDVCMDLRQLVFDLKQYRKKLKPRDVNDFDSRWGFSGTEIDNFLSEIEKQPCLQLHSSREDEEVTIIGKKLKSLLAWFCDFRGPQAPSFKARPFQRLWKDILEVRLKAEEEREYLENSPMSKDLRGNHMILLFKRDLLQGLESEFLSKLFMSRTVTGSKSVLDRLYFRFRIPMA
jgi:hypothetical protein